jgi:hypothetical protein
MAEGGQNVEVLYELAVTAFALERYEESARAFAELGRASRGHSRGSGVVEVAGERGGGDPFEFTGRVVRSERSNRMTIVSDQLPDFKEIWFNPRRQRFYTPRIADQVSFSVGFNYRGLVAVDIERI